jgi:hypothetical protein
MASAPTQEEIDSYTPPPVGPPNYPFVTASEYHKKQSELGRVYNRSATIEEVADALGIPFSYAFMLQHNLDKIKLTGGKKSRRHAKKSRRHAKKSRRHAKKSRRHSKKSRRHAKKSRM